MSLAYQSEFWVFRPTRNQRRTIQILQ